MTRLLLALGLAVVFGGVAVTMTVAAITTSAFLVFVAIPFVLVSYIMWRQTNDSAASRCRHRVAQSNRAKQSQRETTAAWERSQSQASSATQRRVDACRVLNVGLDADTDTIRKAYREKAKQTHPDRETGSEAEFKRVTSAYELLTEES